MIPLEDDPHQRRRRFPLVVVLLIAANILLFIYELSLGPELPRFIRALGAVPAEIATGRDLPPPSPDPVYLTLLTSMFLHGGLLHLAGNMLFLWVFGDNVEDTLGHVGFLGFYLLCGVVGGLSQVLVDLASRTPAIGASGAVAGVLAGYLFLFPDATVRTLLFIGPFITITRISAIFMIGVWILFQLISGVVELAASTAAGFGVAFWAHIGGFAAGLAVIGLWKAFHSEPTGTSPG